MTPSLLIPPLNQSSILSLHLPFDPSTTRGCLLFLHRLSCPMLDCTSKRRVNPGCPSCDMICYRAALPHYKRGWGKVKSNSLCFFCYCSFPFECLSMLPHKPPLFSLPFMLYLLAFPMPHKGSTSTTKPSPKSNRTSF